MKLVMIGTGYVGLVSGVCFSEYGFDVTCVDVDQSKIAKLEAGKVPIYEPGLEDMMKRNVEAGHLSFTTDLASVAPDADVIFIAVGTPSRRGDGEADLTYVYAAAREVAQYMKPGAVLVTKSTVVVGTNREILRIVKEERPDLEFSVASNPEFLREGAAIEDFMRPDRVVVGTHSEHGEQVMRKVYQPLYIRETPIVITSLENAELIKYAANAFLAMKITFINEVANLCEKTGGNVQDVAKAIGLDGRIGGKFLHAGPGFGGSCFPKDTRAYAATGEKYGAPQKLIENVITINEDRKVEMAEKVLEALGDAKGKTVAILGIAFKPNTDDVREAPSLTIIPKLQEAGVNVRAFDPEGMEQAKPLLNDVTWCESSYETTVGADAVVILTEWNTFRALDFSRLEQTMKSKIMVDLRNVYKKHDVEAKGFAYTSIGRADEPA